MLKLVLFLCLLIPAPVLAQDAQTIEGYEARLALADEILELNPPRDQVRAAIERYIQKFMVANSEGTREQFRAAMLRIINYKALEKTAREAYAEIFTHDELAAMLEYYSKPEAISARVKVRQFDAALRSEIVRMMDQAIMRARSTSDKAE